MNELVRIEDVGAEETKNSPDPVQQTVRRWIYTARLHRRRANSRSLSILAHGCDRRRQDGNHVAPCRKRCARRGLRWARNQEEACPLPSRREPKRRSYALDRTFPTHGLRSGRHRGLLHRRCFQDLAGDRSLTPSSAGDRRRVWRCDHRHRAGVLRRGR